MKDNMTLDQASAVVAEYMLDLPQLAATLVIADVEFWQSGLDKYQFIVISDESNETKDEPQFCTMLPLSFFNKYIKSSTDVFVHYMHVMGHKKCYELWKQSSTSMYTMNKSELDFIEEIYNQRLFSVVSPSIYDSFYQCVLDYDKTMPWKYRQLRAMLNTLLTKQPYPGIPDLITQLHTELYVNDPLSAETFTRVMWMWTKLLTLNQVREAVVLYDTKTTS
jgi:hypothetical protein